MGEQLAEPMAGEAPKSPSQQDARQRTITTNPGHVRSDRAYVGRGGTHSIGGASHQEEQPPQIRLEVCSKRQRRAQQAAQVGVDGVLGQDPRAEPAQQGPAHWQLSVAAGQALVARVRRDRR